MSTFRKFPTRHHPDGELLNLDRVIRAAKPPHYDEAKTTRLYFSVSDADFIDVMMPFDEVEIKLLV